MMLEVEGIVLRRTKYGESSLIVEIITPDHETLSLITSGIQSKKGQHRSALLQLGHQVICSIYYKEGRNMHRVKDVSPAHLLQEIPFRVEKGTCLLYMIELVRNSLGKSGSENSHYHFLKERIIELDGLPNGLAYYPLEFTIQLSNVLGFGPNLDTFQKNAYFDMMNGIFTLRIPPHPNYLNTSETVNFYRICCWALNNEKDGQPIKLMRSERKNLIDRLMLYFRLHIENFRTPNSQSILNTVFNA